MKQKKGKMKKRLGVVLSLALALAMTAASFPVAAAESTAATRMSSNSKWLTATGANAADAKIILEKTFTTNKGSFPNEETFRFNFERVAAWYNDNTDTGKNGTAAALSDVPLPKSTDVLKPQGAAIDGTTVTAQVGTEDGDYHKIEAGKAVDASANNGNPAEPTSNSDSVVVTLGKYTDGTYTKDAPLETEPNTSSARTRATAFGITYNRAGYYVYKVKEVNDGVAGVDYDGNEYYIVVDVANRVATASDVEEALRQDSSSTLAVGDTIDGVFVHSVTAWKNIDEAKLYTQGNNNSQSATDLADIKKDIGTDDNTNDGSKAEISLSTSPDKLALNFSNTFNAHDLVIKKNVKGTLGDRTKEFLFEIDLANLAKGTYSIELGTGAAVVSSNNSSAVYTASSTDSSKGTLTVSERSASTKLTVKLKDDASITIKDLNVGATYQVKEDESDHVPSYTVTSNQTDFYTAVSGEYAGENTNGTYYSKDGDTYTEITDKSTITNSDTVYIKNKVPVIVKEADAAAAKNTELQTALETVDEYDDVVTVLYTNTRDITTETGIPAAVFPVVLAGLIALVVLAASRRRRGRASVDDFDI